MLRITKGVVVLLSLGGLVCQFANVHSELNVSPKEQHKSYDNNSNSKDAYLGFTKVFELPVLLDKISEPASSVLRPKLGCPHDISGLDCGESLPLPFSTLEEFISNGGYHEEFCEGSFSISFADLGDPKDLNYCSEVHSLIRRRYTLTDECGYSKSCLQRFVYKTDNTPPKVDCSVLTDVFVGCDDHDIQDQVKEWIASSKEDLLAASSDNCGSKNVSHDYLEDNTDQLNCDDTNGIMVTFHVNDACSQRTACTAKIYPRPQRPDLGQPHDKAGFTCGSSLPEAATSIEEYLAIGGSVEEHCGKGLSISHQDVGDVASMDFCSDKPLVIRRRYTISDGCGNTRSTIQRFEFARDIDPPSIDCGDMNDFVVDCDKALLEGEIQEWISSMQNKIMKSASDNCGGMTVAHDYKDNSAADMDCAGGGQMTVSFRVSDACGNTSQCVTAIVSNSPAVQRPEIVCVDDVVDIGCGSSLPPFAVTLDEFEAAGGEIIQFCDGEISIRSEDVGSESDIDVCSATKNILRRRYIINDECGNEKRCLQRIVYEQDTEAPTVECDLTNDLIINCDTDVTAEDLDIWLDQVRSDLEAAGSDNCSELDISNDLKLEEVNALSCDGKKELSVTFVISDKCGNATSCSVSVLKEETGSSGLVLGNRQELTSRSTLYQNKPNPFGERTTIKFELEKSGKVRFTIYDLSGKLLFDQSKEHSEGINTINITREMLNNISGVVFYSLETNGFKEVKTMIILE